MEVKKRGLKKARIGTVISDKMDKTVVVSVERIVKHPIYGKYVKKQAKYMAHDEKDECKAGDRVKIIEIRPLSKLKRWRISQVLEKA
ncbi:MAG: 30S ribosomal protein S17 [Deltaproteobacteria bacterium GWC2_42_51]|nr:MAG: 30S ribosomal protein S17 [Deltaproteobacteria bacterium GWA2_42_85]OGP26703.1 MAG: 30S ribosomal protein S17 [Deltaproteobacteria bacterium GWB2_42_7]OGP32692.1 MAG: 30S ribosomal protein S17 [Deltaproteobacteria bacterium GWC2_42_51]OGP39118.1 MAG: 30S ribosomal protein S17 [Deltaproteobacteria bacterium GWD2_42_10]OGP47948.1 MAG: 30S ribosomal protein S17 [Deltaproteobacteria bacterium GWF2_42_12]OGQ24777.1 MAG: 30S ribosomal protein S17 [Deltaproteobacteria bacterium RIFCSPHIGHO2_0